MEKRNILLILIAIICIASECNEKYIHFENPVPENINNVSSFHTNFQGNYYRVSKNFEEFLQADSVYLIIKDKIIIQENVLIEKFAKADFDTMKNLEIRGDLIYDLENNDATGYPFFIENDSLVVKYKMTDTIFYLGDNNPARFYKKSLFLNKKINQYYEVSKMKVDGKNELLYYDHIQDSLDTKILQKITTLQEVKSGSDSSGNDKIEGYIVNLSKKELKKFLKMGGFTKNETYKKMN